MDRILQLKSSRSRSPSPAGSSGSKRCRTVSMEDVRNMRILSSAPDRLNAGFNPEVSVELSAPPGNRLDLELENDDGHVFEAGESVIGHAVLQMDHALDLRSLRVILIGEGKTSTSMKLGVRRKLHLCTAHEQYYRKELHLLGARGEDVHLDAGVHVLPFCFALPDCLPSSFEGHMGSIRYSISAHIVSDGWSESQTAPPVLFEVIARADLNSYPGLRQAVVLKENKQLLLRGGKVKINALLERQGLSCGEDIPLRGVISVHGVSVHVHLVLRQTVKYKVHDDDSGSVHSSKTTEDVVRQRYPRELSSTQLDLSTLRLSIPTLPPSTLPSQSCKLINIKYSLRIEVTDTRDEVIVKLKTPVILGSGPARSSSQYRFHVDKNSQTEQFNSFEAGHCGRSSPASFCSAPSDASMCECSMTSQPVSTRTTPLHSRGSSYDFDHASVPLHSRDNFYDFDHAAVPLHSRGSSYDFDHAAVPLHSRDNSNHFNCSTAPSKPEENYSLGLTSPGQDDRLCL